MRLTIMGGVLLGLIAFFIFLITRLSSPQMSELYGNLDQAESGSIITMLESQKIPYEVRQNGKQILVRE